MEGWGCGGGAAMLVAARSASRAHRCKAFAIEQVITIKALHPGEGCFWRGSPRGLRKRLALQITFGIGVVVTFAVVAQVVKEGRRKDDGFGDMYAEGRFLHVISSPNARDTVT